MVEGEPYLVKVAGRTLVFLQVSAGAEGNGARHAAEWPLHVVDVHVQRQLGGPRELLVAHAAAAPTVFGSWTTATGARVRDNTTCSRNKGEHTAADH